MNKQTLIKQVLNLTLNNCQDDSSYNDNTLHDLILFGFKGLSNMTEAELQAELSTLQNWSE